MSQPLDNDLLDDLGEPEGPAIQHAFDEGAGALDDPLGGDGFDAGDELDFDAADAMDELEEAVTEALDAEDADEFWGSLWNGIKKALPTIAKVAPMLPIPGAGLIGKAADIVGKVAADDADELDALDGMIDNADEADAFDAAAPVAAALAIRKAVPNAARMPHQQRKQLVKATAAATRHVAQHHGPAAVAAVPAIVRHARRVAAQRGVPARQLPQLVRQTAAKVAQSPRLVHRFARASQAMRTAPGMGMGMGSGAYRTASRYRGHSHRGMPGRFAHRYGGGAVRGHRHITVPCGTRITIEAL